MNDEVFVILVDERDEFLIFDKSQIIQFRELILRFLKLLLVSVKRVLAFLECQKHCIQQDVKVFRDHAQRYETREQQKIRCLERKLNSHIRFSLQYQINMKQSLSCRGMAVNSNDTLVYVRNVSTAVKIQKQTNCPSNKPK